MPQYIYKGCCLDSQDYNCTLKYWPGEEIAITNDLSRYLPEKAPEIHLDISTNHLYVTQEKKQDYQKAIQNNPLLHALADIIVSGWPEDIKDVPKSLHQTSHGILPYLPEIQIPGTKATTEANTTTWETVAEP